MSALASEIISPEQQELLAQIAEAKEKVASFESKLDVVKQQLDAIADQVEIYGVLSDVCNGLERLSELGASKVFWAEKYLDEEDASSHLEKLRHLADEHNEKSNKLKQEKIDLQHSLQHAINVQLYFEEELERVIEDEEFRKYDFIVEREIEPLPYRQMVMPWHNGGEDEKKFKRLALLALLYSILLALIIPMYIVPEPEVADVIEIPERLAKLIKKEQPKPKPQPKKLEKSDKKPTDKQKKEARKKAATTGLLALKNDFASLLNDVSEAKLGASADLSNKASSSRSTQRSIITSQATSGSGGVRSSAVSRNVGDGRSEVGGVAFSRVESGIGSGALDDRPLSDGVGPSRTDEEIQIVFDRYKAALYRIYNRELRKNPTLKGKMVLRITIKPDGSVSKCSVESTDLDSKTLSAKIVDRVKQFKFGAKEGVPTITILYPIDFLPAF